MKSPTAADLRRLKDKLGLTHGQMAQRAHVSERAWYYYFRGVRTMHPGVFMLLVNGS